MNIPVFGKTMENMRNIEIPNLSQQNEERMIQYQNQMSYHKVFHRTSVSNKMKRPEILINIPV